MSAEIRIEEVTKVISKKMYIGKDFDNIFYNTSYNSILGGEKRVVIVETRFIKFIKYWVPIIAKNELGWGCQVVNPVTFRKILKGIKNKGFKYKDNTDIKIQSFTKVVRVKGLHKNINKKELTEKMELVLKIYNFLYKK